MSDVSDNSPPDNAVPPNSGRRGFIGTGLAGMGLAAFSVAQAQNRSDTEPRTLHGQPVPEPSAEQSAGPISPGRGSMLKGKVAVVTGAARGIGRAIAVEFAANGAMSSTTT